MFVDNCFSPIINNIKIPQDNLLNILALDVLALILNYDDNINQSN